MKLSLVCAAALSGALALPSPVRAQDESVTVADPLRETLISVVATGSRERLDWSGQPIAVIARDEIQSLQGSDAARALVRVPGVSVDANGGPGAFTALHLRGTDAEQVLITIDGVRVEDVAAPSGGFDLSGLDLGEIERIDVLRGSNSVVWGSAALGGVIAVRTRTLEGVSAGIEAGSLGTLTTDAALGTVHGNLSASLDGGTYRSNGISAAASGTEPDGTHSWRIGGRARLALGDFALEASARFRDALVNIDGFPPPAYTLADTREYQTTRSGSGRIGAEWSHRAVELAGGLALAETRRDYVDPTVSTTPSFQSDGTTLRADLSGRAGLPAGFTLDFGADQVGTRYQTTYDARQHTSESSAHALLEWTRGALHLAAGERIDRHDQFGTHTTTGANAALRLGGGWRLRASYGEGFKAPTLYQLLSDYGNAALRPETSRGGDLGIELGDRGSALHLAATLYRRDSRDLIGFVSCFGQTGGICANRPYGTYANTARARAEGFELEGDVRPVDRLALRGAYSFDSASDRGSGLALARRPRHTANLSADWTTPWAGLALGGDLRLVSASFDDAANTVRLVGYAVAGLRAAIPLDPRFTLTARVDNLANAVYQTAAGYGTPRRGGSVGLRARW